MYLITLDPRIIGADKCYFVAECASPWDARKKYKQWCRDLRKNFPNAPMFEYKIYRVLGGNNV